MATAQEIASSIVEDHELIAEAVAVDDDPTAEAVIIDGPTDDQFTFMLDPAYGVWVPIADSALMGTVRDGDAAEVALAMLGAILAYDAEVNG